MAAADFVDWWNEHSDSMVEWDWDNVAAAAWDAAVEFATSHNKQSTPCMYCETGGISNCPHHGSDSRFSN